MSDIFLVNLALIILFLPLIGFTVVIHFGKRFEKLFFFEIAMLGLALILSIIVAATKLTTYLHQDIVFAFNWIDFGVVPILGKLTIELGVKIDNLTAIMLIVVNLISFLVHVYSMGYMKGDPRFSRYYAYLGIFTFSMLGIVLTHNLLMMYIFWELVGLSSYLLIGFWFEKDSAANASKKAFLVNRVGDIGMFLGILILFTNYHTFTFDTIFNEIASGNLPFDSTAWLTAAGILLFMGAVGKSAQFPLHVWLPDAMEGPTPVSALIHAATMVAAGVYLIARIFVMLTADAMLVIAVIGAVTSFIAATMALTQNDIKKVLAYSTISQLGYMVMAMGVGAYAYGFFHLVTHAWFKALLFLGSGSVIHAMHHEQDIREMGGLRKKMPVTYYTFLIATLAISGVPFTSGFLSKDGLLAGSLAFGNLTGHYLIPILGFTVAMLTAFYMFRLVILTFHGAPRNQEKYDHAHESPKVMIVPLMVLAVLS
ncbi:MAG: NADH-quinone oxidoreductase subunit L, partial [Ignavibacteria bacterium]